MRVVDDLDAVTLGPLGEQGVGARAGGVVEQHEIHLGALLVSIPGELIFDEHRLHDLRDHRCEFRHLPSEDLARLGGDLR